MQRSFCLYTPRTAYAVPTRYIRQRGVFVSQFILLMVFGDTSYTMSATSLYAFLVSVNQCIINADFGGLIGRVNSIRYEQRKLAKSQLLH